MSEQQPDRVTVTILCEVEDGLLVAMSGADLYQGDYEGVSPRDAELLWNATVTPGWPAEVAMKAAR
jgi:hypothetical protein